MKNGFCSFFCTFRARFCQYALYSLGVCLSVATVLVVGTLSDLTFRRIDRQLDSVIWNGAHVQLSYGRAAKCAVAEAASFLSEVPLRVCTVVAKVNDRTVSVFGTDCYADNRLSLSWYDGRFFTRLEQDSCKNVCVISRDFAIDVLGTDRVVGCPIRIQYGNLSETFRIIGVYQSGVLSSMMQTDSDCIYLPIGTVENWQNGNANTAYWITRQEGMDDFVLTLQNRLGFDNVTVNDSSVLRSQINRVFLTVETVLSLISGVSLVVAAFMLFVLTRIHVRSRIREIGLKKSLGARNADILWEFIAENSVVSAMGAAMGVLLDVLLRTVLILSGNGVGFAWRKAVAVTTVALIFSVTFCLFPSLRASRLPPADTLRRDG